LRFGDILTNPTGKIQTTLSISSDVEEGDKLQFGSFLDSKTEFRSMNGWIFSQGVFSVRASEGVELAFGDPDFLSGQRPAPVPLPFSGFLLLGGLAALGTAKRRRPKCF